jgi:hypothetical protein
VNQRPQHPEMSFRVSAHALRTLFYEARERKQSPYQRFRDRAWMLSRCIDPRFSLAGQDLTETVRGCLAPSLLAQLELLAGDLDVSPETLGELILSHETIEEDRL